MQHTETDVSRGYKGREVKEEELGRGEVWIPTLPCCYLAPSLWTGLVWARLCCLTGAG